MFGVVKGCKKRKSILIEPCSQVALRIEQRLELEHLGAGLRLLSRAYLYLQITRYQRRQYDSLNTLCKSTPRIKLLARRYRPEFPALL